MDNLTHLNPTATRPEGRFIASVLYPIAFGPCKSHYHMAEH